MLSGGRTGRRGAIALELAITMPVLVVIALAAFDLVGAVAAWRRVRAAATSIAEIATSLAVNTSNSTNQISSTQAAAASTAIYPYIPALYQSGNTTPFAVTLSAVVFEPLANVTNDAGQVTSYKSCAATCVCLNTATAGNGTITTSSTIGGTNSATTQCYSAYTAWSVPELQHGATQGGAAWGARPCASAAPTADPPPPPPLTPVADGTGSTESTLPMGLYGPYSLLVADVAYTFTPMFLNYIMGNVTFTESAYVPPRIGTSRQYVQYSPDPSSVTCPGL